MEKFVVLLTTVCLLPILPTSLSRGSEETGEMVVVIGERWAPPDQCGITLSISCQPMF